MYSAQNVGRKKEHHLSGRHTQKKTVAARTHVAHPGATALYLLLTALESAMHNFENSHYLRCQIEQLVA